MFYKVVYILISLGGVGPRTLYTPYVVTHTTSGIYILISNKNLMISKKKIADDWNHYFGMGKNFAG